MRHTFLCRLLPLALALFLGSPVAAQSPRPVIRNSNVGYLDTAIPGNQIRFQFDSSFDLLRPNRGEFFWSPGGALGGGPERPESSVDYQDVSAHVEALLTPRLSAFVGVPLRFL